MIACEVAARGGLSMGRPGRREVLEQQEDTIAEAERVATTGSSREAKRAM